jgi:hypothetical protein
MPNRYHSRAPRRQNGLGCSLTKNVEIADVRIALQLFLNLKR